MNNIARATHSPAAPVPADIFVELRSILMSARMYIDDLVVEVDTLTSLDRGSRTGTSRSIVRQSGDCVQAILLAAQHMAAAETRACIPQTMSMDGRDRQHWKLARFSKEVRGMLEVLDEIVEFATAVRFKPRTRRLRVFERIALLISLLRHADRDLAAAWTTRDEDQAPDSSVRPRGTAEAQAVVDAGQHGQAESAA
ncbi:hypothetical protein [Sorangium cellulosum]|uniref:hypothetical protein n=1 Tax=Sorangium cellulosum TaxID=56 RepID=UPI0012DB7103|nr:hypothetical protein [Sorangium cellulosum]